MDSTQMPPTRAGGAPSTSLNVDSGDQDSEWEYEYSKTETETYYVTLDISKADFITRQDSSVPSGRGGNKERVLSDIFARKYDDDLPTLKAKKVHPSSNADGEPRTQQNNSQQKEPEDQLDLNEFQILELHSETPLVTYRGRVYEGSWARNIGTEMLFTRHDEDNPLPALRQLEKGVDLLAASSARIQLTEKSLKPASAKAQRRQPKVRFESEVNANLGGDSYPTVPDPEPGASAERYAQGDFLAKLIALKKRKGEADEVTVIARLHDEGKKKAGQKKPKVEDGTPRPARGRGSGQGRGGGRPRGRGRARGRGVSRSRTLLPSEDSTGSDPSFRASTTMDEDDPQLTPERWSRRDVDDREDDQDESPNESSEDNDEMDVDGEYRQ